MALWTPAEIPTSNLRAWLDRDDDSTVSDAGGGEFNWADKSGNGHDHVSAGAPGTVTVNDRTWWQFDGAQEFIGPDLDLEPGTEDEHEAFVVLRGDAVSSSSAYEGLIAQGAHGSGFWLARYIKSDRQLFQAFNNGSMADNSVSGSFPNAGKPAFVASIRKRVGFSVEIFEAAQIISLVASSGAVAKMTTGGPSRIGRLTGLSSGIYFNGAIGEVVVVRNADQYRDKVVGYLHHRHGVSEQLLDSHPYKLAPPAIEMVSGTALKSSGGPVDYVRAFIWPDGPTASITAPNSSGEWLLDLGVSVPFGITYVADGCAPITHGPYTPAGE